jgi:polar amino acid transport system permease protein
MQFLEITLKLLDGLKTTTLIFALTLLMALPLGLIISFGSMSKFKPLAFITKVFVWIIRGVPLMLQIFIIYYVPSLVFGLDIWKELNLLFTTGNTLSYAGSVVAVLIAFVINYACYFSEIYRGGIESISKGQYEAGQVLGMTKSQIFFKIVLMQVVKRILPPMSNEIITLVKDTALARVIMVVEIIQAAQNFAAYGLMWPLFYTAVFYLIFVGLLSLLFGYFEKKLGYYKT